MPGDTFGQSFRVTNWGESHGKALGVVVEGMPPNIEVEKGAIQADLDRRRPGQSHITTARKEPDQVDILSGVEAGKTTGTPISMIIFNRDQKPKDYANLKSLFRPSHADFTYHKKYGLRTVAGGGRSSARVTAGTVAAGALAKAVLKQFFATDILAYVCTIKDIATEIDPLQVTLKDVESNIVRCPDGAIASKMIDLITETKKRGDSVGGIIQGVVKNIPPGLGEPLFDKIEADLAKANLSINATKGFEIGSGFAGTQLFGSQHNDAFTVEDKKIKLKPIYPEGCKAASPMACPSYLKSLLSPPLPFCKNKRRCPSIKRRGTIRCMAGTTPASCLGQCRL